MSYDLPSQITIPLLDIRMSLSTCIAIIILLILFFSFFSLSISIGGGLSPENIAKELNSCDANEYDLDEMGTDTMSNMKSFLAKTAVDLETEFVGGLGNMLDGMGNEATGGWSS